MLRRFLVLVIACAWLAGCGGQSTTPTYPLPQNAQGRSAGGPSGDTNVNELPEPPELKSINGIAKVSLTADINPATGLPALDYEQIHGVVPTIRVNPGDTIALDVADDLPPTASDMYDINIHFHGMGSSPKSPGDDVLGTLARPGQKLHYVVHIPKNQEPGLYWYHPHVHGEVNFQVGESGMSGALIVNGLERHFPQLAKMRERLIIVRDTGIGAPIIPNQEVDGMPGMEPVRPQTINSDPCDPELGLTPTLNGAIHPVITIAPGAKQFFRLVNAAGHKTLKLSVDGGKIEVVAIDGFALDTYPGTPPTLTESSVVVPAAARAEFVVTGPQHRFAKFRSLCFDSGSAGDRDPNIELARFERPRHNDGEFNSPGPLKVGAPLPRNVYTEPLPPPVVKRTAVFSEGNKHFLINGKVFSMNDPPMFTVHVGTVEEWRIVNVTEEVHDFHIHQIHFAVERINGVKLAHPYWADSVVIPHRQKDGHNGTLTLLMDFRDPIIKGMFVFHCHIVDHEDHGMMAKIQAI